jgi:hypothetical protein
VGALLEARHSLSRGENGGHPRREDKLAGILSSLVNDSIMPIIGVVLGGLELEPEPSPVRG